MEIDHIKQITTFVMLDQNKLPAEISMTKDQLLAKYPLRDTTPLIVSSAFRRKATADRKMDVKQFLGEAEPINEARFDEPDPDNPNVWYALVYDNNFPNNKWSDRPVDNRVKLIKKDPLFGDPYFEFDYYPLPDIAPDYRYTSLFNMDFSDGKHALISAFQAHMFVVTNTEKSILID